MLQSTISKLALCAAGGAVAAMTAVGPASAVAVPSVPDGGGKVHKGWTTEDTDVHKRPSSYSPVLHTIDEHRKIYLKCKVRNQGDTWYKLAKWPGWVNSDTVHVRGHVPHCRWMPRMDDQSANDQSRNDQSRNDQSRNDRRVNDQSVNDATVEDASLYPAQTGRTAGEPLG